MRKATRRMAHAVCLAVLMMVFGMPVTAYGAGEDSIPATSWTAYAANSFAGGDGSEAEPYQIGTPEELAKLSQDVNAGEEYEGKYFKLISDIDLSGHVWVPIGLYEWDDLDYGHFTGVSFRGSLDGDGHTITNMTVDQRTDQHSGGLFGNIQNAGNVNNEIKNLIVKDARIYSSTRNGLQLNVNGILSAVVSSDAEHTVKITNVDTSGIIIRVENVSGYDINGGMLGQATRATVTNCHVRNIDIAGTDEKNDPNRTGGFVGMDNNSSYENCTAAGSVSGRATMGGFVGCSEAEPGSMFRHCMADVKVHASDWNAGGFIGYSYYTKIYNCVAKGDVESTDERTAKVGGFAGLISSTAEVKNSHAAGKVTGVSQIQEPGGFAGQSRRDNKYSDCSFDGEKNSGLKASGSQGDREGVNGVSTQQVKANICRDYDGKHQIETVEKKEATCTEDGIDTYYICNACGTMYSDADQQNIIQEVPVIKAPGHKLTEIKKKVACTEDGNDTYYICENCGTMFADADQKTVLEEVPVIKATGHMFGEWKITKKPNTEAEGVEERVCENCQYTETRNVAKLESKSGKDVKKDINKDVNKGVTKAVKTSDENSILLTLALMMAAVTVCCIEIIRRKTNH